MKKKMISLLLVLALVVGICPAAFAAPITYVPYSDSVTTREEQEAHERELFRANPDAYKDAGVSSIIIVDYGESESGLLRAVDPGEGAIRIDTGNMYTLGNLYWDSEKQHASFKEIANVVLAFAGLIPGSIGKTATALSIASAVLEFNNVDGKISMESAGHVKAGHSVSYRTKTGEFYCNNRWEIAVYTQQKYHFAHLYASVVVDGTVQQKTKDEVPANGYSAYDTVESTHFYDHKFIQDETQKRYREKKQTGYFGTYDERWF